MPEETKYRNFSNWLKAYTELTAYSEAPLPFHFWTGVSCIAGALRRKVYLNEDTFVRTPNFYIILVGPPGVATKSTSMSIGTEILREVPGVSFGPNSLTWQALTDALAESTEPHPIGYDTQGEPITEWSSSITCAIRELGTFLRPKDEELVTVLTDLYDGQAIPWTRRTSGKGEKTIENPWINIIGCTTPSWLQENIPESMIGGGLISRVIFVYGDKKSSLFSHPSRYIDRQAFNTVKEKLTEDLIQISQLSGEYNLTDEAFEASDEWYRRLWTEAKPLHLANPRYEGYISRKHAHIIKLAMILAASQRDELLITKQDFEWAKRNIDAIESDMIRVFQSIGLSDTARSAQELIGFIRAHGSISKKELVKHMTVRMPFKDLKEALDTAQQAGYIEQYTNSGNPYYRYVKQEK